jgi:hypothetical protein
MHIKCDLKGTICHYCGYSKKKQHCGIGIDKKVSNKSKHINLVSEMEYCPILDKVDK